MLDKIFSITAGAVCGMVAGVAVGLCYNSKRLKADKELLDTIESYDFSNQEQNVVDAIDETKKLIENDIKDSKSARVVLISMLANPILVTWTSKYVGTISGPCMLLGFFIGNVFGSLASANYARAYQTMFDVHTTLKGALNNER